MTSGTSLRESCDSRAYADSTDGNRNRRTGRHSWRYALSALALGLTFASGAAMAAENSNTDANASSSQSLLPTVTVTAQFRKDNGQSTPIAVTAVNAAMISARGQTSIFQLLRS